MQNPNENQGLTFREYLKSQQNSDSPTGDLAKDALQDIGWEGSSPDSLLLRMKAMGAELGALKAFRNAETNFKNLSQDH
jgi:hypothetical protein